MIQRCNPQKPSIQSTLDSGVFPAAWDNLRWHALFTRSRHEKIVNKKLREKGIESFLPTRKIVRQWSDRKKIIEEPLFTCYVFVRISLNQRWDVLNLPGAVRLIGKSNSKPSVIDEAELTGLRRFIGQQLRTDPFPYLKKGDRVYVRSGPLKGIEGFIVRKEGNCRLVLSLDLIMQSVAVEIDEACVERI